MGGSPVTHEILQLNLHQRLAVSLATAVLCLLAVAIAGVIPRRHLARAAFAGAAVLYVEAYSMAAVVAPVSSPALIAWLPNAAVTGVSLLLLSFSARELGGNAREAREVGRSCASVLFAKLRGAVGEALELIRSLPHRRLAEQVAIQGCNTTVLSAIFHVVKHFSGHTY